MIQHLPSPASERPLRHAPAGIASLSALALSLVAGCAAVGPNYAGPPDVARPAIDRPSFERAVLAPVTAAPPPSRWWDALGDPILVRLIDDAFVASPTLQAAEARVRSARAQQAVNRAALGPTGGTGGRYVRGRIPTGSFTSGSGSGSGSGGSGSSIPNPIRLDSYTVDADASWEIDLFGGKRRGIESATAAAESRQAALEDAQVRLAGDVGKAYGQLREAQNRLALASDTVELRSRMLAIARQRQSAGTASQGDVARAEGDLSQARADVPGIATTVDQQLDQLAILSGRDPGAYDALLAVPSTSRVATPLPPDTVPVGTPADWLRHRPDIREAERTLASRNATIGQNVADLFPSVSIFGLVAGSGSRVGDLFRSAPIWLATPSLTWNFLNIPSTRAKIRGAEADRDESLADYQRTVLEALQDANDSLSKFGRGRQALLERGAARDAAARAASITRERYTAGTAGVADALEAERQRVQADDAWVQAAANYLSAYVSLQKSLGLGWGPSPAGEGAGVASTAGTPQGDRMPATVTIRPMNLSPVGRSMSSPARANVVNQGSVATTASGRSAYSSAIDIDPVPRGHDRSRSQDDVVGRRGGSDGGGGGGNSGSNNGGNSNSSTNGTDNRGMSESSGRSGSDGMTGSSNAQNGRSSGGTGTRRGGSGTSSGSNANGSGTGNSGGSGGGSSTSGSSGTSGGSSSGTSSGGSGSGSGGGSGGGSSGGSGGGSSGGGSGGS